MSIGSQLRQAREAQSFSLDQASQATRIRLHYLEAMEADQFEKLPSTAHLRGFLRAYAKYLKIDASELIQLLDHAAPANPIQIEPTVPTPDISASPSSSEAIFKQLGTKLCAQRELMGLSLGDVERHTHIRIHYIQALETGDIAHLPSPVQGRGMLNNYASFLGLDKEAVLLQFADGLQADLKDRRAARGPSGPSQNNPAESQVAVRPSPFKRLFSVDLLVGGFVIVFLLGFSAWGALRISRLNSSKEPSPTAPPVTELLLSSPQGSLTVTADSSPQITPVISSTLVISTDPISGTVQPQPATTQVVFGATPSIQNAPLQLNIIPSQRAWLRVIVDGEIVYEDRVIAGSAYSFAGNERIEILTGDGSSLHVYFNQQDLGVLGALGEVVNRIYTIAGVMTPTPSIPSTSTPAPTGTETPTVTGTPSSNTATPTPTPKP